MSEAARSVFEAVQRIIHRDCTLEEIFFYDKQLTDAELAELVDCLLAHPHAVTSMNMSFNWLTDETGVKLARYLAASSTIERLSMYHNKLGPATYLAMAAALRDNSSLRYLYLYGNQAVDQTRINPAFVDALRLNPDRPADSVWCLHSYSDDLKRLRDASSQLGHPSLQLLLALLC